MANDLAAMVARIAAEMQRPDLAAAAATAGNPSANAIRLAINTAITEYQKERFAFSDINPGVPTTFLTVVHQSVYPISAVPNLTAIYLIDYVQLQQGNTLLTLRRMTPKQIHSDIQINTSFGLPGEYAYEGNSLIFYPVPDQVYTVYLGGHIFVAAPATDAEANNPWMTNAELLIRQRAKYEIYKNVLRNDKMALAMSPDPDDNGEAYKAYTSLKRRGNKITGTGRVRAPQF